MKRLIIHTLVAATLAIGVVIVLANVAANKANAYALQRAITQQVLPQPQGNHP